MGRRVGANSDDIIGLARAASFSFDATAYQAIKSDLEDAVNLADVAIEAGEDAYDALVEMERLAEAYAAQSDPDVKQVTEDEFEAQAAIVENLKTTATYNGIPVFRASNTNPLMSIDLDPHGNATFDIQFDATDIPDVSGFDLSGGTTADDVRAEIEKITTYRAKAQSFGEQASSYYDLVDVVINSNEAAGSVVRESNEVKELARLTDLQVRQQTLEAMSAQANVIRSVAAKLFDIE